jgi:hypothetical protein
MSSQSRYKSIVNGYSKFEEEYFPSLPSQSLTELSNEAEAINRPSGENAT